MIIKKELVYHKPWNGGDTILLCLDDHTTSTQSLLLTRMYTNDRTDFELITATGYCLSKSIHGHLNELGHTPQSIWLFRATWNDQNEKLLNEFPALSESVICDISRFAYPSVRFLSGDGNTQLHVIGYNVVDD